MALGNLTNEGSNYQTYTGGDDSFLPVFLIMATLIGISGNVILTIALMKFPTLRIYTFVRLMCYLNLGAGVLVYPLALVATTDGNLLANCIFCEVYGFFNAFFYRASLFNVCVMNIERFVFIANPMNYKHTMPSKLSKFISAGIILLVFFLSVYPILLRVITGKRGYKSLSHVPVCLHIPSSQSAQKFAVFDAIISFFPPWMAIFIASIGMLKIACTLAPTVHHDASKPRKKRQQARCKKDKNGIPSNEMSYSSSSRNTKAFKIIAITLFVFSVLNAPLASLTWIIISRFNSNGFIYSVSSDLPTLEYIACIGMQITYIAYPIFNGLINRDIRSKVVYMMKNAARLHDIDFDNTEPEEIKHNVCQINLVSRKNTYINITISKTQITEKCERKERTAASHETEKAHCSSINTLKVSVENYEPIEDDSTSEASNLPNAHLTRTSSLPGQSMYTLISPNFITSKHTTITSDKVIVYRSVTRSSHRDEDSDQDFEHNDYQFGNKSPDKTRGNNQHFVNTDANTKVDLPGMIGDDIAKYR